MADYRLGGAGLYLLVELPGAGSGPEVVFEAHLYLDTDASGKGGECVSATIGAERLQPFVTWLKANGRRGYLGEIGAPNTLLCEAAVHNALEALEAEPTLWIGWAWWSAGHRWPLTYALTVQPILFDAGAGVVHLGADRPQMEWIRPFIYRNRNQGASVYGATEPRATR